MHTGPTPYTETPMTPSSRIALLLAVAGGFTLAPSLVPSSGLLAGFSSVAEAADFTGKIKRIRIKKTRAGSQFKVVARTQSSSSSSRAGTTVTTSFVPLDGGPELATQVATDPKHVTSRWSTVAELPFGEGEPTVDVFLLHTDGTSSSATLALTPGARTGWTVAEGAGAPLRVDAAWLDGAEPGTSRIRVFVRGNTADWDPTELAAVDAAVSLDGAVVPSGAPAEDRVNDRFVTTLAPIADPTGFSYSVTTTVADAGGATLDTQTETVVVGADDVAPTGPQGIRASTRANGTARIRAATLSGMELASPVTVSLTDAATGTVVIEETLTTPTERVRFFNVADLEFDDVPIGQTYLVVVDLVDASGTVVGAQREMEARVLGADELAVASPGEGSDGMGPVGVMLYEQEDGGFGAYVEVHGTAFDVAAATVTFEEPFEGPTPLETEVTAEVFQTRTTWQTTSAAAAPEVGVLTITDANGTLSGTVELPETLGKAAGNGKGTRKVPLGITEQQQIPLL